jgi:hypothetical protein
MSKTSNPDCAFHRPSGYKFFRTGSLTYKVSYTAQAPILNLETAEDYMKMINKITYTYIPYKKGGEKIEDQKIYPSSEA